MRRAARIGPVVVLLVAIVAACSTPSGSSATAAAGGGTTAPSAGGGGGATTAVPSAGGGGAAASVGTGGAGASAGGGGGGGGGAAPGSGAVAALAAAAKNACTLMPVAAVKAIIPKASAPVPEPEPNKCSMSDGNGVVEITIDANPLTSLETLNPCQPVSGVGVSACLQEQQPDDAYLQVLVNSASPTAILYVEVAGHDGKSHATDAANVAKAILAALT